MIADLMIRELVVVGLSYMLAGIPIMGVVLAGMASPLYAQPRQRVLRWWGWGALLMVVAVILLNLGGG